MSAEHRIVQRELVRGRTLCFRVLQNKQRFEDLSWREQTLHEAFERGTLQHRILALLQQRQNETTYPGAPAMIMRES